MRLYISILLLLSVQGANGAVLFTTVNPANGHTYHIITPKSWTNSEAEAVSLGGHLATIDDASENQWIKDNLLGLGITANDNRLWIGLTDNEAFGGSEGSFVWVSGSPVTFLDWDNGQPSGTPGNEDFVEIRITGWNDLNNPGITTSGPPLSGIVEVVPIPGAVWLFGSGLLGLIGIARRKKAA